MKEIIRKSDIDKLPDKEQIEFYKKHFQYQHCELDGCGHEVRHTWALYDGDLYCDSCFDFYVDQEKEEAKREVERLQRELEKAKQNLNKLG